MLGKGPQVTWGKPCCLRTLLAETKRSIETASTHFTTRPNSLHTPHPLNQSAKSSARPVTASEHIGADLEKVKLLLYERKTRRLPTTSNCRRFPALSVLAAFPAWWKLSLTGSANREIMLGYSLSHQAKYQCGSLDQVWVCSHRERFTNACAFVRYSARGPPWGLSRKYSGRSVTLGVLHQKKVSMTGSANKQIAHALTDVLNLNST